MPLNKVKPNSDMYQFLNDYPFEKANRGYTWNVVKGQCPDHNCLYCYMHVFKLRPRRFDKPELKTDLGQNNFIFVGSSNDMFSASVPSEWIIDILHHCRKHFENQYLFQSKNPERFLEFQQEFPVRSILCTTLETNRSYKVSKAPSSFERMLNLNLLSEKGFQTIITIEPIMDFDLEIMVQWIKASRPAWVNIGADSKGHNLPEPSWEKVEKLIEILSRDFEVVQKDNLKRLKRR